MIRTLRSEKVYCIERIFAGKPLFPGGGDSDRKWTGMLVVSLRGVNFDFGLAKGVLGKMLLFLAVKVSFRVAREEITKKKEF